MNPDENKTEICDNNEDSSQEAPPPLDTLAEDAEPCCNTEANKKATRRSLLLFAGFVVMAISSCALIGYYHAQKKYSEQHYLFALAAKRLRMVETNGKCFLIYDWNDGRKFSFDVDEDRIHSYASMQPIPSFAAEKHLLIPMNDEVTQALVAGGLIGSVKSAVSKASSGGGSGKSKIFKIGLVVGGTISGYFLGDIAYRKINPPEFSDEMIAFLERKDVWEAAERATIYSFASRYSEPGQFQIPKDSIKSADILVYVERATQTGIK